MSKSFEDMATLNWWLGVVVVGIIINLVSVPIGRLLSRLFSGMSEKWRNRSARRREVEENLLQTLIANPDMIEGERDRASRKLLSGMLVLMIAIALLSFEISNALSFIMDRQAWSFLKYETPKGFMAAILIVASVGEVSSAGGVLDRVLRARKALGHLLPRPEPSRLSRFLGGEQDDY